MRKKRVLSVLLSTVMLLSLSFSAMAASADTAISSVTTIVNNSEKCVVKEIQSDCVIISTNDKRTNTLTIKTYDSTEETLINTQELDLDSLAQSLDSDNGVDPQSGDDYQHTFTNREYDIYYAYETPQWQIRSQNNRKSGYESTVNSMSYLESFREAVEDVNSSELDIIGTVGSTIAVTAFAAYLTGGIGAGSAAAGGSAAVIAAFTDLNAACRNADYYFNRVSFRPY